MSTTIAHYSSQASNCATGDLLRGTIIGIQTKVVGSNPVIREFFISFMHVSYWYVCGCQANFKIRFEKNLELEKSKFYIQFIPMSVLKVSWMDFTLRVAGVCIFVPICSCATGKLILDPKKIKSFELTWTYFGYIVSSSVVEFSWPYSLLVLKKISVKNCAHIVLCERKFKKINEKKFQNFKNMNKTAPDSMDRKLSVKFEFEFLALPMTKSSRANNM